MQRSSRAGSERLWVGSDPEAQHPTHTTRVCLLAPAIWASTVVQSRRSAKSLAPRSVGPGWELRRERRDMARMRPFRCQR
jgi:hypothetical protein